MPYRATVYKVMIASPGDVPTERRMASEVVYEWNAIHADDRKIVLSPVGWETHATPEMGDRPQAIINKQILKDCDLLVAIFWTRLGSPTGNSASGTVEEINEHLRMGKPAMIYFSSVPVRPDSVDEKQYKALREFKETCRARGLIQEYESISEFREKFTRQLAQTIIRVWGQKGEQDADEPLPPNPEAPPLSDSARELLIEVSKDGSGTLTCVAVIGGYHVQTNNREFVEKGNARSEARWRAAVAELVDSGLIEDRGHKGEVYSITDAGYRVADLLGQVSSMLPKA